MRLINKLIAFGFILFLLLIWSCQSVEPDATYTIGFSQCTTGDAWRQMMQEEMKRELRTPSQ